MSTAGWSRRKMLMTLGGLGSLCALTVRTAFSQVVPVPVIDNQYRIKAKLLSYLPEYMTWDDAVKQKGTIGIGVITHGDPRTDFKDETRTEKLQKSSTGRKINWLIFNTTDELLNATPADGSRLHLVFVMRKTIDVVQNDLNKLDQRFGGKKGVVLVTDENSKFFTLAALNFWEDLAVNRIKMQIRKEHLITTIGVTPKKELLQIDGVTIY